MARGISIAVPGTVAQLPREPSDNPFTRFAPQPPRLWPEPPFIGPWETTVIPARPQQTHQAATDGAVAPPAETESPPAVSPARDTQPSQRDENPFVRFLSESERRDWQQRRSAQTALPASISPERPSPTADAAKPRSQSEAINPFAKYANPEQSHQGTQPPPQEPAPAQPAASNEGWDEYFKGIARSVAQGVTFNWADEIEAFARTAFGGDQEMARARIRDEIEKFQKRHPYLSTGAEIAGAIAVPGAAGMRAGAALAGRGAGLIRKATAGGAVGVTEGALAGAGAAQGHVTGDDGAATARGAGTGAVVGGVLGAALPGAGHIAGRMFEGAGTKANRLMREALEDDATLARRVQSRPTEHVRAAADRELNLAGVRGAPSEANLATVGGESVQALAREAAQTGVRPQAHARRYVDEVRAARPGDLEFQRAYSAAPISSRTLDNLIQNRPALRQADALARRNLTDMGITPPTGGNYSAQYLHELDRALRDASERQWRAGQSARATAVDSARASVQRIIQQRMPLLASAQARYAHGSEMLRRAPQSTDASRLRGDPAASAASNMLGLGANIAMGHKMSAMGKVMNWALSGGRRMDERTAEAVLEVLLTRARDQDAFRRIVDQIDNMDAPRRGAYLSAALASTWAGKLLAPKDD